ncbi:hypothetical protein PN836_005185 [Ningiella sp. W23]|uniref:hypothetical protein n=1 Tax=Ningiella sp. W23 TaxID=3023715 RepID=UPI003756E54A
MNSSNGINKFRLIPPSFATHKRFALTLLSPIVLAACASQVFTQWGVVLEEEICYENDCFTTVRWEDGSFSTVDNRFLPNARIIYRHCVHSQPRGSDESLECSKTVYETPLAQFDRNQDEVEAITKPD